MLSERTEKLLNEVGNEYSGATEIELRAAIDVELEAVKRQADMDVLETIELSSLQKFDPISGEKLSYFVPAHVINKIKAEIEGE